MSTANPKTVKSKTTKKVVKTKVPKVTKVPKDKKSSKGTKLPAGNSKLAGKSVVAYDVIKKKKNVHMEVTKVCEHKLSSGRSMFRFAGHSADAAKNRMSLIVAKDDAKLGAKVIGSKIVVCKTHKVIKKKKSPKAKKE